MGQGAQNYSKEFSSKFHPEHFKDLTRSGLGEQTIQALGIHTVRPQDIAKHLGFNNNKIQSLLCFPYPGVDGFCRDKVFPAIKGKDVHALKYLQRQGSAVHPYIPPRARAALNDPDIPLYFTEGEKKAAKADQEGYPTIGLGGLWNWLQNRKPIAELDQITWSGRKVFLVPDSDTWKREELKHAVYALGRELERRGAVVRVVKIPQEGKEKVGLDDFLVAEGPEALKKLEPISLDDPVFKKPRAREKKRRGEGETTLADAFPALIPTEAQHFKLPHGYVIENGGIAETHEGGILVTQTPVIPIERIKDLDSALISLRVIAIQDNRANDMTVPAENLADQRRIVGLAGQGVDVSSKTAGKLVAFLQHYNRLNRLPTTHHTKRLGCHMIGEKKIYLLARAYPERKDLTFHSESEIDLKRQRAMEPRGALEEWARAWHAILPYPKVVLTVLASLAPPVRELLNLDTANFITHLNAQSSTGKTVTQKIALSVWANPEDEGWRIHGHATFAGIETLCLRTNGLPTILEDALLLREEDRRHLIYAVGNEQFKARGGRQLRTQWPWRGVMITSGEGLLVAEDSAAGEAARVIQLNGPPFGQQSEEIRTMIDQQILPAIRANYALVGPKVIRLLLDLPSTEAEKLRTRFADVREQWAQKAQGHFLLSRQAAQWATLHLVGSLLVPLLSPGEEGLVLEALETSFQECRSEPKPDPARRAHELLTSAILSNEVYCYTDREIGYEGPERKGTVVGVINHKENWVACYRNFAENELRKQGFFNPTRIFQTMRGEALLTANPPHLTYPIKFGGERKRMILLPLTNEDDQNPE